MENVIQKYRFNVRGWLRLLPIEKRNAFIEKIVKLSGQSKDTIRRIIYMKITCNSYVRPETKDAICKVFGKSITDLENTIQ